LAFLSIAIYPPNKVLLDVVNLLSPKPLAPVNIVLDLPLPLAISVLDTAVACETSGFVGATTTGAAGGGAGGFGLEITPPILSS
jgi:hypothetical protein